MHVHPQQRRLPRIGATHWVGRRSARGFTLLELMLAVIVAGILIALAASA